MQNSEMPSKRVELKSKIICPVNKQTNKQTKSMLMIIMFKRLPWFSYLFGFDSETEFTSVKWGVKLYSRLKGGNRLSRDDPTTLADDTARARQSKLCPRVIWILRDVLLLAMKHHGLDTDWTLRRPQICIMWVGKTFLWPEFLHKFVWVH